MQRRWASHLAAYPAIYVAACVALTASLLGFDAAWPSLVSALIFASATAAGAYLLDRAKLRRSWLDPADQAAQPERFAAIERHQGAIRLASFASLACAGVLALVFARGSFDLFGLRFHAHLLALAPISTLIGVFIYAGRPRRERPRPKDLLALKNAFVALGIASFAASTALLWPLTTPNPAPLLAIGVGAIVTARVFADAILCDLDDAPADRAYRTRTFPVALGASVSWRFALGVRATTAIALAVLMPAPPVPRCAWALATLASTLILFVRRPSPARDWVEAALAIEAVVVLAITLTAR
ncbi:MAG: hypothetical protein RBS39_10270 [Phycisphaerales bacterium]|nr:hypothetical protein [Phycisphaerales bacterium]